MTTRPARHPANALAGETSPYLLQHAHNPVSWRPWGQTAIDEARTRGVPLFVSIGYATCYWCHVMERESFEDEATAQVLNQRFVPVKVDREQRPDIDEVYMTACQVYTAMTEGRSSGGWPLSVFVDPASLQPFHVGTYYPPEPRFGRPSFTQLLEGVADAWRDRRREVLAQAERIAEGIRAELDHAPDPAPLDARLARAAVDGLLRFHDQINGGFGGAPKFPQPSYLELLAAHWHDPVVAEALRRTLDHMAKGGVFDQVGGGFHRYAVDATWSVPHFEKMLYDNAQLASLYARSFARTGDRFHAEIARRTCAYVLRELTDEDGAFFSAQDAEVNAREGESYVWAPREVEAALDAAQHAELIPFARTLYGLDRSANFHDPHHPDAAAGHVLALDDRPEVIATRLGLTERAFAERRARLDAALLEIRARRPQPATDDKVLLGWNGLMVRSLAEAGALLEAPEFIDAAKRAALALAHRLRDARRQWMRSSRGRSASIPAFLEDHAAFASGLLALGRVTGDQRFLAQAREQMAAVDGGFSDPRGGFFDTREGQSELFVRVRNLSDGAVPCGSSMMLRNALELWQLTGAPDDRQQLRATLHGLSGVLHGQAVGMSLATAVLAVIAREAPDLLPAPEVVPAATKVTAQARATREPSGAWRGSIELSIAAPWHLTAPGAGEDRGHASESVSIRLLAPANRGLEVDFPAGEPWRENERIYRGRVHIPFRIAADSRADAGLEGGVVDDVELLIRVQPCNESVCERPRELRVSVRIAPR